MMSGVKREGDAVREEGNGQDAGTEIDHTDQGTMMVQRNERPLPEPPRCPKCQASSPPGNLFCLHCGTTLRDFEVRDQRASLDQSQAPASNRPGSTLSERGEQQQVMRRTSTYLGRIRRIEPGPMQFGQAGDGRKQGGRNDSTALIVGVVSISLLVVVVIVLVLVLVRYL